jgi:hypothetical protein
VSDWNAAASFCDEYAREKYEKANAVVDDDPDLASAFRERGSTAEFLAMCFRKKAPPDPQPGPVVFETREEAAKSGMWIGPPVKEPETFAVPIAEPAPLPVVDTLRELLATAKLPWYADKRGTVDGYEDGEGHVLIDWCTKDAAALSVAAVNALPALLDVYEAAQAVYEHDDFVTEPSDGSRARDAALGEALAALARVQP